MASLQEMKKFFITASKDITVKELLVSHLPAKYDVNVIIESGGIWKEKKRIFDPGFILKAKETVKIHTSTVQGNVYRLDPRHIVFENEDFMVVYKPTDLNVHGTPSTAYFNLTYGVNTYLKEKGTPYETTPITRLDRPVEGLVIFSKNKPFERRLFDLIKRRKIKKWYVGALEGTNLPRCMRIQDKINNDGNRTHADENGKEADSLFIKTKSLECLELYSIFIFTGRRHQIRFHASHYMSPVVGDWFYGSSVFLKKDELALMCKGYNIPYQKKILRIRAPQFLMAQFFERCEKIDKNEQNKRKASGRVIS